MTTSPPEQPRAMKLIRARRKQMRLSYIRAGKLAGISDTRWRQLEDGYRVVHGTTFAEEAPAATLARMAFAVSVLPPELAEAGRPDAAAELDILRAEAERLDGENRTQAARMVAASEGLTDRQKALLADAIAAELSNLRDQ
jgi:transcriptional regulator with XRE-family HTH domain